MKNIEWNDFVCLIDILAKKVKNDNFAPDILIGVARGGWIPTIFLSNKLNVKKITSIGLLYRNSERTLIDTYSYPQNTKGKKILLIEDRLESGKSLAKAKELIESEAEKIKTLALFIRSDSIIIPAYYTSSDDDTIVFPWE